MITNCIRTGLWMLPDLWTAEAEPLYKRALAVREKALGPDHPDVANSLENYAALLRETGRGAEANKMEARAEAMQAKHPEWTARQRGFFDRLFGR